MYIKLTFGETIISVYGAGIAFALPFYALKRQPEIVDVLPENLRADKITNIQKIDPNESDENDVQSEKFALQENSEAIKPEFIFFHEMCESFEISGEKFFNIMQASPSESDSENSDEDRLNEMEAQGLNCFENGNGESFRYYDYYINDNNLSRHDLKEVIKAFSEKFDNKLPLARIESNKYFTPTAEAGNSIITAMHQSIETYQLQLGRKDRDSPSSNFFQPAINEEGVKCNHLSCSLFH